MIKFIQAIEKDVYKTFWNFICGAESCAYTSYLKHKDTHSNLCDYVINILNDFRYLLVNMLFIFDDLLSCFQLNGLMNCSG